MEIGLMIINNDYDDIINSLSKFYDIGSVELSGVNEEEETAGYWITMEEKKRNIPGRPFKFHENEIQAMKDMKSSGASIREIARRMKVSPQTVVHYLNPEKRKHK